MTLPDIATRLFKSVLALVGAIAMDYAFLQGRMTRQAVAGFERAAADAPVLVDRLLTSIRTIRFDR
ncbi:hypothetical protein [Microvirga pudoricolor]|uniref:hypothetical protein n=1 Tax=Microvirga pudoricolor TaxID=2778729 RepID=UPI0019521352|nr:hypothetical protein [Microvirga pudoricolor]MBM6594735.1 hypothetical protein [Microvirga pudoricolor]